MRVTGYVRLVAAVFVSAVLAGPMAAQQPAPAAAEAQADAASCSKIWVGREAEIEEFLRTAEIEKIEEVGVGVTKPKRAIFKDGGLVKLAAWKPLPPGIHGGFWDSYKSEIAAYEIDKLLGMQMVPPAVERRVDGQVGAMIMWIEDVKGWKMDSPVTGPDAYAWSKQVSRMKLFDNLIGNTDRNQGNLIYDGDWHLILIDHSRALTNTKKEIVSFNRADKALWVAMQALTYEQLKPVLDPWLGDGEIKAIITRRDNLKKKIDDMIKKTSEPAVLMR
jgi:hypothetical protein